MAELHAIVGPALGGLIAIYVGLNVWSWTSGRGWQWSECTRWLLVGLVAAQNVLGLLLLLAGDRPSAWLHLVYGFALLSVLLGAPTFIGHAPPARLPAFMVIAGAISLLVVWRLLETG